MKLCHPGDGVRPIALDNMEPAWQPDEVRVQDALLAKLSTGVGSSSPARALLLQDDQSPDRIARIEGKTLAGSLLLIVVARAGYDRPSEKHPSCRASFCNFSKQLFPLGKDY